MERVVDASPGRLPRSAPPPPDLPRLVDVDGQARTENFPVALRLLPRRHRSALLAIYGFARLTDDIGDDYAGDRLAALDWLEGDLEAAVDGSAQHPVVARLTPVIHEHGLDLGPFRDLIEANRLDQRHTSYATFEELLGYCRLSANPVGRLVLAIFDSESPATEALSDRVCSGLQIVEHLQDVAEDHAMGRVYLPRDDLSRFGVTDDDLAAGRSSPALRDVIRLEADRARRLLEAGDELTGMLPWTPRLAVAGFVAGGRAALAAIERGDHDVLAVRCRPRRRDVIGGTASAIWSSARTRRHRGAGPA